MLPKAPWPAAGKRAAHGAAAGQRRLWSEGSAAQKEQHLLRCACSRAAGGGYGCRADECRSSAGCCAGARTARLSTRVSALAVHGCFCCCPLRAAALVCSKLLLASRCVADTPPRSALLVAPFAGPPARKHACPEQPQQRNAAVRSQRKTCVPASERSNREQAGPARQQHAPARWVPPPGTRGIRDTARPVPQDSAAVWWPALALTAYAWRAFLAMWVCTVCTMSERMGATNTAGRATCGRRSGELAKGQTNLRCGRAGATQPVRQLRLLQCACRKSAAAPAGLAALESCLPLCAAAAGGRPAGGPWAAATACWAPARCCSSRPSSWAGLQAASAGRAVPAERRQGRPGPASRG